MKLTKYSGNPILSPNPNNDWESLVVCNPGVFYDNNQFFMLYRAAGNDEEHIIRFGLATSKDGINFTRESDESVLGPSSEGPDMGWIEDARIIKLDDYFYVTYAFRPFPPGQYWKFRHDEVLTHDHGSHAPHFIKKNMVILLLLFCSSFKYFFQFTIELFICTRP